MIAADNNHFSLRELQRRLKTFEFNHYLKADKMPSLFFSANIKFSSFFLLCDQYFEIANLRHKVFFGLSIFQYLQYDLNPILYNILYKRDSMPKVYLNQEH